MENSDDVTSNVIQMVISTIEEMSRDGEGPSFQDMVGEEIMEYAQFTKQLAIAESSLDATAVIAMHPGAKALNDKVQQYLKLADRGLVTINPSPTIQSHIYHPLVREVSDEEAGQLMAGMMDEEFPNEFIELVERIVISVAAGQLLGGIQFWIEETTLTPNQFALVHPISSTKH